MDMSHLAWQAVVANRDDIKGFVGDVAEMGRLHLKLLAQEAEIEKARLKKKALLAGVLALAAALTLLFTLTAVILLCWDTAYRTHAIVGVPLTLLAVTVGAAFWLRKESAHAPFERFRTELRKDGAWLMSLF